MKVKEGSVVGRLTVLSVVGRNKIGCKLWECLCSCGNKKIIPSSSLNSKLTQSCGCLYNEIKGKQAVKHNKRHTKEYNIWSAMKQRCKNPKTEYFNLYGGRGISVCERWESFKNFYEDMGECPEGMSLDRIDVDGDYEKSNCRWVTNSQQSFNTRKSKNNTSGKTGVLFHKASGKWIAKITKNGEHKHLGVFDSKEDAIRAREKAELDMFGFIKE